MSGLRDLIAAPEILLAPGIYDALSAHVAEQAGAKAAYLSGASISYTRHGRPDIGLVSMSEVTETIALIRDRVSLPLIVDADTGFGNALNVQRTMRAFERAGADAIQLEDQTFPKRCGHLAGKSLVPAGEMTGKIRAAADARESTDTLIIARTDAIAVEGFDQAIGRAAAYREAGADILFVEAPRDEAELAAIPERLDTPCLANMVEGGRTPLKSAGELQALGYSTVVFPGGLVRALLPRMQDYFATLVEHGTTEPLREVMTDFEGIAEAVGTADMIAAGKNYEDK